VKLLVTGGCGFIGSNFVRHVLASRPGYGVVNLDKLTYAGNPDNLRDVEGDPRYRFVKGDICDGALVRELVREVDAVVNFAAESVVAETLVAVHWGHGIKLTAIEELFLAYGAKRGVVVREDGVDIVEPNLPLFALAFRNGMGQWQRITHITRHRYSGKVVRLRQKWGSVTVTPNHSVYDADSNLVQARTNPELLAIRKMNVDRSRHRDYVDLALPGVKSIDGLLYAPTAKGGGRPREVFVRQTLKGSEVHALMRFLGAYVAEGNALFNRANGSWQVCIANRDVGFLRELQRDVAQFSNAASSITLRDGRGVNQLVFSSHVLYLLVTTLCGAHSWEKRVPDALFTLLDEHKQSFLDSYLRGDGNTQWYRSVASRRFSTNSTRLAAGLGLLLSMLDLDYSVYYADPDQSPHSRRRRPAYAVNIVSNYDTRGDQHCTELDYDGYVYDLTVERAHNFAAGIGNVVVHNTHVDRSLMQSDAFLRTDVFGVFTLLETVRERPSVRLLQVSTDEVYGSVPVGSSRETDPLRPTNPYSASKAAADLLCGAYWTSHRVPVMITRASNNFGPYQYPEKVIPLFVTNAIDDQPLPLYGDGRNVREWLHVADHCAALDLVLHEGVAGEVYNVGGGVEIENIALTRDILRLLDKPESLIRPVPDRPGHDRRYSLDSSKLRRLGWQPRHSFDAGLAATVAWYRANGAWWRPLKSGEFRAYYARQYRSSP
jgi:dTDP-glucose 4,6-dehydratase